MVVKLVTIFLIFAHYVTCCWYMFGLLHGFVVDGWVPPQDLELRGPDNWDAIGTTYVASLYHALAMITGVVDCDSPETTPAVLFHIIVMCLALMNFAYLIALVYGVEQATAELALAYQARIQYMRKTLCSHKLPQTLVRRAIRYHEYCARHRDTFNQRRILQELPEVAVGTGALRVRAFRRASIVLLRRC